MSDPTPGTSLEFQTDADEFAYIAGHDLKEPLRGMMMYAQQLLEAAPASDETQRQRLENLLRLGSRMDAMLDALLRYSRLARTPPMRERIDMNEVVVEALDICGVHHATPAVEIAIPKPLPVVVGDRVQLREVLCHLIANAITFNDHAPRRVEIGVIAAEASGPWVFYVRDNGIGIAEKHHEPIFTLFRRLHGRDQYGGGVGAGLTLARRLIALQHGRLWLESTPGQGSTFYFTCGDTGDFPP